MVQKRPQEGTKRLKSIKNVSMAKGFLPLVFCQFFGRQKQKPKWMANLFNIDAHEEMNT